MKKFIIVSSLAVWTAFVAYTSSRQAESEPSAPAGESAKPAKSPQKVSQRESGSRRATATATSDPKRLATARETIEAAAVRYEPSAVRDIRPWLLDSDPEIRQLARDGMVMLGEADAIPFLRDAASRLTDSAEVASLHEAADLLSLPAWSDSEEARRVMAEIVADGNL
ncbi:hypothetical protein OKA04_07460 [Luteolibacter flavescens]|uniref:HEAT repeat domain-containing protein n=1 Tax=Luteolibacter flavescens TaxID=1859460 RepID=A0ABT3FLW3_9BACT|nr:hypothetical protein [Luteolibacter flavescens]MCW1884565.1 hypothetical protein [Luteolibacter flavescens]